MVSGDDVLAFWARWFSSATGSLPSGPRVRLHSLPGSDQYPRCLADRVTILRRHNDVLAAVLGEDRPYVLLAIDGDDDGTVDDDRPQPPPPLDASAFSVLDDIPVDDDDDGPRIAVHWAPLVWSSGSMDAALLAVANETLTPPVFVSVERGAAVRPYPGGIDVFVRTDDEVASLSRRFAAWLPGADGAVDLRRVLPHTRLEERAALTALLAAEADPYLDDDGAVSQLWVPARALSDELLVHIGSLRALTSLNATLQGRYDRASTTVTDTGIAQLQRLPSLEWLRIASFPAVTTAELAALRVALPGCAITVADD